MDSPSCRDWRGRDTLGGFFSSDWWLGTEEPGELEPELDRSMPPSPPSIFGTELMGDELTERKSEVEKEMEDVRDRSGTLAPAGILKPKPAPTRVCSVPSEPNADGKKGVEVGFNAGLLAIMVKRVVSWV